MFSVIQTAEIVSIHQWPQFTKSNASSRIIESITGGIQSPVGCHRATGAHTRPNRQVLIIGEQQGLKTTENNREQTKYRIYKAD